jgi:hypothetical protein
MQAYANEMFTPKGNKQINILLTLLEDKEYLAHRTATHNSLAYKTAVSSLRELHKQVYTNPAQYKVGSQCLWQTSGLYARCLTVARQFKVPHWDVVSHANGPL